MALGKGKIPTQKLPFEGPSPLVSASKSIVSPSCLCFELQRCQCATVFNRPGLLGPVWDCVKSLKKLLNS